MKKILALIILLFLFSCKKEKEVVLSADREAPLGWIYLNMYDDKSFEFISKGMIRSKDIYAGNYSIKNDTIYFKYKDSIPKAGTKAILINSFLKYIDGEYPESVEVKINKIK
jgi:hypothetical protein